MTNYEHYKKEIELFSVRVWGMKEGIIQPCAKILCEECAFHGAINCRRAQFEWMSEKYPDHEIDWSKVPVDTKILVSDDGESWQKRYFASYNGKCVFVFQNGCTSWSGGMITNIWKYAKLAEEGDQ